MKVKNPDGTDRILAILNNNLAAEVMDEAKKTFDDAEKYRASDWSAYSARFYRACRIEEVAHQLDTVMKAPNY